MKLYKKLLYTMCMAGSITLTGCDDFLTPDNKSAVNDVEYFTTSAGLQALTYDAYAQLKNIFNSSDVTAYFNSGTDLYQDGRNDISAALHRWSNFTPEKTSTQIATMEYVHVLPFSTMLHNQR